MQICYQKMSHSQLLCGNFWKGPLKNVQGKVCLLGHRPLEAWADIEVHVSCYNKNIRALLHTTCIEGI